MPIIYSKRIRRNMANIDLNLLKKAIVEDGFKFIRDGGFRIKGLVTVILSM